MHLNFFIIKTWKRTEETSPIRRCNKIWICHISCDFFTFYTTWVRFLDVAVSVNGDELETNLYYKPTGCHQFLEFNLTYPIHNKKSIVHSQGLRIKKLFSSPLALEKHFESICSWFGKLGSTIKLIHNQLRRIEQGGYLT